MRLFTALLLSLSLASCAALRPPEPKTEYVYHDAEANALLRFYKPEDGRVYGLLDSVVGFIDIDGTDGKPLLRGILIVTDCHKTNGTLYLSLRDENGMPTTRPKQYLWNEREPEMAMTTRHARGICALVFSKPV